MGAHLDVMLACEKFLLSIARPNKGDRLDLNLRPDTRNPKKVKPKNELTQRRKNLVSKNELTRKPKKANR